MNEKIIRGQNKYGTGEKISLRNDKSLPEIEYKKNIFYQIEVFQVPNTNVKPAPWVGLVSIGGEDIDNKELDTGFCKTEQEAIDKAKKRGIDELEKQIKAKGLKL
jgi:hypothetical protein